MIWSKQQHSTTTDGKLERTENNGQQNRTHTHTVPGVNPTPGVRPSLADPMENGGTASPGIGQNNDHSSADLQMAQT